MDNRWLSGSRTSGNEEVVTRDHLRSSYERNTAATTYKWIVRSTPGNGSRRVDNDPKKGNCLKYGDIMYLQNNYMDNRWLSGSRTSGNEEVVTRDHLRSSYERNTAATTYKWIVRSTPGNGSRPWAKRNAVSGSFWDRNTYIMVCSSLKNKYILWSKMKPP